jgi:hypothetical protein
MKKVGWAVGIGLAVIITVAIMTAGNMGTTSHAIAKGKIVLDEPIASQAQGIETLFIIALGNDRPMPLGAFKKTMSSTLQGGDIYDFTLTKDNMQLMGAMGGEFPNEFRLKARLDRDGVAGPDQPGDLVGEIAMVHKGDGDLELRINRVIQ